MIEEGSKFWYGLKPEVYVHLCEDKALVYDTERKRVLISEDRQVLGLLGMVDGEDSLGCTLVDWDRQPSSVQHWILMTCDDGMALTFLYDSMVNRPVILRPLLSLNKDVDKIKNKEDLPLLFDKNITCFLSNLNIYVNSDCGCSCAKCGEYCKQFPFCCNFGQSGEVALSPLQLITVLKEACIFQLNHINIFGGDVYDSSVVKTIRDASCRLSMRFRFYVHYQVYQKNEFVDSQEICLLIPAGFDTARLLDVYESLRDSKVSFCFVVEQEGDIRVIEEFVRDYDILRCQLYPFYTGENKSFFEKNVYMTENELMHTQLSLREIFRNQKLNANNFGSLYVLPDGSIKSNIGGIVLGYVGHDSFSDVICKELAGHAAWRKIRDAMPCSQCIFQYICPPPSGYDQVMKRNNLCYVHYNK